MQSIEIATSKGSKKAKLKPRNLVWVYLSQYRFPNLRKYKLMPHVVETFKILEKVNDNAYKLELPLGFGVCPTFNILDLKLYLSEEDELESRTTLLHERDDDEDTTFLDILQG
jgi:hypothetical protein